MKNKYGFVGCMLLILLVICVGATSFFVQNNSDRDDTGLTVVTSFYPMYIATMNVVGEVEGVELKNLSEPQTGCLHDFQLTPEDMKLLSKADVFVINGGGIESFMTEIAREYPDLWIIEAGEQVEYIREEEEHEQEEEHEHEEANSHVWLSVENYRTEVDAIAKALAEIDSDHSLEYQKNAKIYDEKLQGLSELQEEIKENIKGKPVVLFHEAFAYLAQDLGVETSFILDLDEERQVSAGEISKLLTTMEEDKVNYLWAEELYGKKLAERVMDEKKDITTIYLDPLTRGDYEADSYLKGMNQNLRGILKMIS